MLHYATGCSPEIWSTERERAEISMGVVGEDRELDIAKRDRLENGHFEQGKSNEAIKAVNSK